MKLLLNLIQSLVLAAFNMSCLYAVLVLHRVESEFKLTILRIVRKPMNAYLNAKVSDREHRENVALSFSYWCLTRASKRVVSKEEFKKDMQKVGYFHNI